MMFRTISASPSRKLVTTLTLGILSLLVSEAAKAVSISFETSSSPTYTFFSDSQAVNVKFEGTEPILPPFVTNSINITENVPLNGVRINSLKLTTRNPSLGLSETQPISYTFTISDPNLSEPQSITVTYDLTVSFINNITNPVLFVSNLTSPFQPTTTFDLGTQGLLDVTFLTPVPGLLPPNNEGRNGQLFSANFLLRPSPTSVPEASSTLGILAFGVLGAGSLLKLKHK